MSDGQLLERGQSLLRNHWYHSSNILRLKSLTYLLLQHSSLKIKCIIDFIRNVEHSIWTNFAKISFALRLDETDSEICPPPPTVKRSQHQAAPTATGDPPWRLLMPTHDNVKILLHALNNNTSPRGLNQMCSSHFLARQRRERVLLEESRAEGNGGGLVGMRCWGMSWMMKWHTEGINEHAWRLPAP